jgi:hypothetical protein
MQNKTVARFLELKETIALMEKEMDKIKEQMKEIGSFETSEFVVTVSSSTQNRAVDANTLCDTLGFEVAMAKGLIKQIDVERVTVRAKQAA